ncbi:MAG: hypothetical protein ACRENG_38525, partial [bacterium]
MLYELLLLSVLSGFVRYQKQQARLRLSLIWQAAQLEIQKTKLARPPFAIYARQLKILSGP